MKRVALIVQRYGEEVNGGAEFHCRMLAEKLNGIYDIEVLTSCATDYISWANEYQSGLSDVNGVCIRRFEIQQERQAFKAHRLNRKLRKRGVLQKGLKSIGLLNLTERAFNWNLDTSQDTYNWSKSQGPFIPDLITYLRNHSGDYDALIFFTYLYYPTLYGLGVAPWKSILIPTAHDEPPLYLPVFKEFFKLPKAILYNTDAEKNLVNRLFQNESIYSDIVGVGIDSYPHDKITEEVFPEINKPYLVYIGRIDEAKGCSMLFEYFLKYIKNYRADVNLVLMGKAMMSIPHHDAIIHLGFVSDAIKNQVLSKSSGLVIPSFYESLSLVTLESMQAGIPVIGNAKCEVIKSHIIDSGSGFVFENQKSFDQVLHQIFDPETDLSAILERGKKYVAHKYQWDNVIAKIQNAVEFVSAAENH